MKKFILFTFALIACFMLSGCGNHKLNETVDIKEDNIKLTVLGSEKLNFEDDGSFLQLMQGEYVKVQVKIENTGSSEYKWTMLNFSLDEAIVSYDAISQSDYLKETVAPGETAIGCIYFKVSDGKVLSYTTHYEAESDGSGFSAIKYQFDIK